MQRIPPIDPALLEGDLLDAFHNSPAGKSSFFTLQAHAPTAYAAYRPFSKAIFAELQLDPVDRELVVLAQASLENGEYELAQHERIARTMGISEAEIEAVKRGDYTNAVFSKRRQALLAFAKQVVKDVRVDDATFDAVHEHYSYREIVETMYTIGNYMMLTRISEVARLELDGLTGIESLRQAQAEAEAKAKTKAAAKTAGGPPLPNRRIVTGLNADGKSCVIFDGPAPTQKSSPDRPGYANAFLWKTTASPASNAGVEEAAGSPFDHSNFPPGGSTFFMFRQPGKGDVAHLTPEQREHALHGGLPAAYRNKAGAQKTAGMHATDSIDYITIIQGEITLILEDGEVTARAGDVVIDRGVAHAWENRGQSGCLMTTVMIDAAPLRAE